MKSPTACRALVLGAISRDWIVSDSGAAEPRAGGVVHHAGLALATLEVQVRVVTRIRRADEDALLAALRARGVEVSALPSPSTTTYVNDYRSDQDRHELRARSDPIRPEDVPPEWREADLIQLGPLHPEDILPETLEDLRGLKGLDLQGFFRAAGPAEPALLARFWAQVDVVQLSECDVPALPAGQSLEYLARRYGVPEVIVTRGARGAILITAKGSREISTDPIRGGNPMGAGDVFLAAYLVGRVRGREPGEAAQDAARAAAMKIRHGQLPKGFRLERSAP